MRKIMAMLLAAILLLALFAGCSDKKKNDDDEVDTTIEGTYRLKTVKGKKPAEFFKDESDEDAASINHYYELNELDDKTLNDLATLTVNKDGTYTLTYADDVMKPYSGLWEKNEDGGISFGPERVGRIFPAEFKNGKLTFPEGLDRLDDVELVFGKK